MYPQSDRAETGKEIFEVHASDEFHMVIPAGWRDMPMNFGAIVLYLNGDGRGFPTFDDTGSPLQVGMTVEKFPDLTESLDRWGKNLAIGFKTDPRFELQRRETKHHPIGRVESQFNDV